MNDPIKNFVELFSKLPSIGPRQATRLAFYITTLGKGKIRELAEAVDTLGNIMTCARCFRSFTPSAGQKLCSICNDPKRNKAIIAIVEKETDLISLERTHKFSGWYLVTGELAKTGDLSPEQKLRFTSLKSFVQKELSGSADEIILAINPTTYGDFSAGVMSKELKDVTKKISRLGRGIPTGGEIEFADADTLANALERRT